MATPPKYSIKPDQHYVSREDMWNSIVAQKKARVVLLEADHGYGKSSFLQWLLSDGPKKAQIIASHACRQDDPRSWSADVALNSIHQQRNHFPTSEKPLLTNDIEAGMGLTRCFQSMFPQKLLLHAGLNYYLLFDALDEIDVTQEQEGSTVVDLLLDIRSVIPPWLTIIATAQPRLREENQRVRDAIDEKDWVRVFFERETNEEALRKKLRNAFSEEPLKLKLKAPAKESLKEFTEEYIEKLLPKLEGNFRYLYHKLKDFESPSHGDLSLACIDRVPQGIFAYYRDRFRYLSRRSTKGAENAQHVARPKNNLWRDMKRILAVLQTLRDIGEGANNEFLIAGCAGVSHGRTKQLLEKMISFVSEQKEQKGCWRIEHNSFRAWLATIGITRDRGDRFVAKAAGAALRSLARRRFRDQVVLEPYFVRYGIPHILSAANAAMKKRDYAEMLGWGKRALSALAFFVSQAAQFPELQHQLKGWNGELFDLLFAIHREAADRAALSRLSANVLLALARHGSNDIPNLYPILRILVDWHFDKLRAAVEEGMLSETLLARYALGRALADSYRLGSPEHAQKIMSLVEWMFAPGGLSADRELIETGAYAFKFITASCSFQGGQVVDSHGNDLSSRYHSFANFCSGHVDYNYRMILSEMLIEVETAGRRHDTSVGILIPNDTFWQKTWYYHETDFAEFFGVQEWLRQKQESQQGAGDPNGTSSGENSSGKAPTKTISNSTFNQPARTKTTGPLSAACQAAFVRLHDKSNGSVETVKKRLDRVKYKIKKMQDDDAVLPRIKDCFNKYYETESLLLALPEIKHDMKDLSAKQLTEFLTVIAWHPVWEVTEAASSIASELRPSRRQEIDTIICEWANEKEYWQSRYAAVDAAYNSRAEDEGTLYTTLVCGGSYEINQQLKIKLPKLYTDPTRRVRFLCAEVLFLTIEDCIDMLPATEVENSSLQTPFMYLEKFQTPLKYWAIYADDCSLLQEMFQFAQNVAEGIYVEPKWYYTRCRDLMQPKKKRSEENTTHRGIYDLMTENHRFGGLPARLEDLPDMTCENFLEKIHTEALKNSKQAEEDVKR